MKEPYYQGHFMQLSCVKNVLLHTFIKKGNV